MLNETFSVIFKRRALYSTTCMDGGRNLLIFWPLSVHRLYYSTELRKSQCIVKIIFLCCLPAAIFQVRFFWPHENQDEHGLMLEKDRYDAKRNSVSYMSDELGLHRVENTSHSNGAVSLHLYSPPFASCQVCNLKSSSKISLSSLPYYF